MAITNVGFFGKYFPMAPLKDTFSLACLRRIIDSIFGKNVVGPASKAASSPRQISAIQEASRNEPDSNSMLTQKDFDAAKKLVKPLDDDDDDTYESWGFATNKYKET